MRRIRNSLASITVEKEKMVDLVKLYPQPRRRKIFGKRKGGKYLEKKSEKKNGVGEGEKYLEEENIFCRRRRKRRKIC